ncbi:MAG: VWA domain-containing protein [Bacteroidota bacterium]
MIHRLPLSLWLATLATLVLMACDPTYSLSPAIDYSDPAVSGDQYERESENPFIQVSEQPVSTFSIDADGASYANTRRYLGQEQNLPPAAAIRTEEFINYFDLDYPADNPNDPISLNGEVSACPWNLDHRLIRIGIQGENIPLSQLPATNFVFLIDVSGSMGGDDRLDLLKEGFEILVEELTAQDRISIVTYAGSSRVLLESTPGDDKRAINKAIRKLKSGGSTGGAEGIITAYEIAQANFITGGNNRVIIGTDGDFNVGISDTDQLIELIEEKRDAGVFLTVLGVGRGNLNDAMLEQLSNHGNGTFEYLDKVEQLEKVFLHERDKFVAVAKDVKVQVAFEPEKVEAYRLIGYENRVLDTEDFTNDSTDAGEIGAGQNITALYEIVPAPPNGKSEPSFTIDFRYKEPDASVSQPMELAIFDEGTSFEDASDHQQFITSVAAFALILGNSDYKGTATYDKVLQWVDLSQLDDPHGYKAEFRELVERAGGM